MKKKLSVMLAGALTLATVATSFNAFAEVNHDEELVLDFYNVAANYQGTQSGWYGKILKDNFNLTLNIIAPQVSGSEQYQTRTADGNLGDLVILDNADAIDCVDVGLIADLTDVIGNYPNLMKYKEQIDLFNASIGDGTKTFCIPLEMNTNGPTAFKDAHVSIYPRLPWDVYTAAGAPQLQNLDDLLDCLKAMMEVAPESRSGKKTYGISLWPDWDSSYAENVAQLTKIYGQETVGSILLGADNSITPLTDKEGAYYKILQFFFKANQMGIVDPDSATQDWNNMVAKMQDKDVFLLWYSWQYGFTNSPERGESRENYMEIPVADTYLYQPSNTYYGDGRVIAVGSGVEGEKLDRVMEFLDWYASPDGLEYQHIGSSPLIYTVNEDGTYSLTEAGEVRYSQEVLVPEEEGGGNWNDGNNAINQWIVAAVETNPKTGEPYTSDLWASYKAKNQTTTTKEWAEMFGAEDDVAYLTEKNMLGSVASVNIALAADDSDISFIRNQCGELVKDTSWKMIFAADEAEFDALWDGMVEDLAGLDWDALVEFDTAKYQPVIEARQ